MIIFSSLPVDGPLNISSKFGKRNTGISGASKNHAGVDIKRNTSKAKTNILAVKAGVVSANYYNSIRGNVVVIRHNDTYETLYQHMAAKSPLKVGSKVKAGDIIGLMGSTGTSSGTHLHFELHENGKPIDPQPYLQNIEREVTDMTESEIRALVKEILNGEGTENSEWFKKEFAGKEGKIRKFTDGSRPQGVATREEVFAMIARAVGI